MNKYVYTITTVLFFLIAVFTVSLVANKDDTNTNAAEPVQTAEVTDMEEPESETVVEEQVTQETVIEEQTVEEPVVEEPAEEEPEEETVDEDVTYYVYTVKGASWLNIRSEEGKDNDPVATIPRGYKGYVVEMTGHWTLLCADGYIGYCSDSYLELEEIAPEDFPDELKGYDASSAGTRIAEGKIGEVEESNEKSVKWL
ncbi:hypothetical protein SAMN05216351_101293 [Pseudobutyrivibrio sp. JW11]|uniref:SH3 domain-containing protein n=1 Tax=Pseudobutyrivibrio sp. JW11 TaxID=1855302 RepID=UPI0008E5BED5|nr:SH3 domain-containing protein [Pseudobutyrivibrio sp. JW11]SFN82693.1 hypothetical protein SAMN05216351_101293 [Pseudobutyrivibrio sp. JW11]